MPRSVDDVVAQMRQALQAAEPELDTTIGSPARKMLDAVAGVVAEVDIDSYLLDYQYDIDSKSGADLDTFVALFGFTRLVGKRASGTITFERAATNALGQILIPVGTQVATLDDPPVVFATTAPAILGSGVTSIEVPARAIAAGTSGNVIASAIRQWITAIAGITSFTNTVGFTGGTDDESDNQLRQRFKRTVFRSLAGTEDMYVGVALENQYTTQANVVGASKHQIEQIDIESGFATSTVQNAKYVYPNSNIMGADLLAGDLLGDGVQYTFLPIVPPTVQSLNATTCPDGVYQLEFDYVPSASRNDPTAGITNRVDIFVDGVNETAATETLVFSTANVFTGTPGDPLDVTHYIRKDGNPAIEGNYFIKYSFTPVMTATDEALTPGIITVGGIQFHEGTDFFLINDISPNGMTPRSNSGVEWVSATNGAISAIPADGTTFQVSYTYNSVPTDIESSMDTWRLVTSDARVHQAKFVRLNLFLAVIYDSGASPSAVNPQLTQALSNAISSVSFDGAVQISDLLAAAHAVTGVDAVRFLNSGDDPTNYGLQQIADDGTTILQNFDDGGSPARARDVLMDDDEIPVLNNLTVVQKAQNTMGGV